jgi:hypothetical protein
METSIGNYPYLDVPTGKIKSSIWACSDAQLIVDGDCASFFE